MAAFAAPLGVHYTFEAELLVVIIVVNQVSVMPSHPVSIESDSSYVVHLLRTRSATVSWFIHPAWENCLALLSSMHVHVSHMYHEGNQVANKLSNMGISLDSIT